MKKLNKQSKNDFFNAYITCALWSSINDQDREPLDSYYDISDFNKNSLKTLHDHAIKFFTDNIDLINKAENYSYSQAGHDLWLTENGHGAGFWDRDIGDIGEKLTDLAGNKETYIWVGGDGALYI